MDLNRYRAVIGWFQARPAAKRVLRWVSYGAVAAVYLLYIGQLVWLAAGRQRSFWPMLVVPAAAFVVGSALRAAIDRPRPYVTLGYQPLFPKKDTGRSMPSRHCFSAAAIAVAAACWQPALGAVLGVLAVAIAVSRVVTGVHYISDVLAGLAFGGAFSLAGWQLCTATLGALGL